MPNWFRLPDRRIDLRGRVVLISGGSRGLGLELAREYGKRGARLALVARDADTLERAHRDLSERGVEVLARPADIADRTAVGNVVAEVVARFGTIDVLVNDAGTIKVGPVDAMTIDDYRRAMDTHFWGPLYAIEAVLPHLRAKRFGRIVNIASIGGRVSFPHLLPYNASKSP